MSLSETIPSFASTGEYSMHASNATETSKDSHLVKYHTSAILSCIQKCVYLIMSPTPSMNRTGKEGKTRVTGAPRDLYHVITRELSVIVRF